MNFKTRIHIIWCLMIGKYTESKASKDVFIDVPKSGYPSIRIEFNDDEY